MELRDLLIFLRSKLLIVSLASIAGCIIGIISFYVIPVSYEASGSFFINRAIEYGSGSFFSYEGYYSQQVAQNFTTTLIGLFESIDMKRKVLVNLGEPINDANIRRLYRAIRVKKAAPQLVTVTVRGTNIGEVSTIWNSLAQETLNSITDITVSGDPKLHVLSLDETPIIRQRFWNIWVNALIGLSAGFIGSVFVLLFGVYIISPSRAI